MFTIISRFAMQIRNGFGGTRVPIKQFSSEPDVPPARFSGVVHLHTGNKNGDRVGSALIALATENGAWEAVPWRLLRNTILELGLWDCYRRRWACNTADSTHGTAGQGHHDDVPPFLRDGILHLLGDTFVIACGAYEDYLVPTDKLLGAVTGIERARRHPVENFAASR